MDVQDRDRKEAERCRSVKSHSREIIECLNPLELLPYFDNNELLNSYDNEIVLMDKPRHDKVRYILKVLETTDKKCAYTNFVKCLSEEVQQGEGFHMGHQYLLAVLKGEQYCSVDDCQASQECKESIKQHRKDMHDIDLSSLVPVMYARNLLTNDERDMLLSVNVTETTKVKIARLLQILDTKGPLAYTLFSQCLDEEKSHPTHAELHSTITCRKRPENPEEVCSIPKRVPERMQATEPLRGEVCKQFLSSVQTYYSSSSWTALEGLAQDFILQNKDPQLRAMGMIMKGYSLGCRGIRKDAIRCLGEAEEIASSVNESNHYFLMARCKLTRATIYRYKGRDDESLKENSKAFECLSNCEPGDDASRVMYGIACARLEKVGKTDSLPLRDFMEIKAYFKQCLDYGREGSPPMSVSKSRCLIRLAQLSLRTTTNGCCLVQATSMEIKEAESYLEQVDVKSVSRRCQALYHGIESDLFKSKGDIARAIESAKEMLQIAEEAKLGPELHFAKSRLQALKKNMSM